MTASMHLVPRWILPFMDPNSAHFVNPLVEVRALLQGKVPPDVLEGAVPRNLLPSGNKPSNIVGVDVVGLIIGNGVHGVRHVEEEKRGIVGFLVKATRKEVLTTQPSNSPSLI